MSLGIRTRTINWLVSGAQSKHTAAMFANRAADVVGNVLQDVTRGLYRKGLSRAAVKLTLHRELKSGDILSIKSGQVVKDGSSILINEKLFEGVNIEHIEVTENMCTPEGMVSYLRWEAIENRPNLITSLYSLSEGLFLGTLSLTASFLLNQSIENPIINFGLGNLVVLASSIAFLPYYKLFSFVYPKEYLPGQIKLRDVEGLATRYIPFSNDNQSAGFFYRTIPGIIFVNDKFLGEEQNLELILTHEKAHLLGGSEFTAHKIMDQKELKSFFYGKKRSLWPYILGQFLGRILRFNLLAIKLRSKFYCGPYGLLSHAINDDSKKAELVREIDEKIERDGLPQENFLAFGQTYRILGRSDKALPFYQKALNEVLEEKGKQLIYFLIALTHQDLGNKKAAIEAFHRVIDIGKIEDLGFIYTASQKELEKLAGN